jgi:hypothetical protein
MEENNELTLSERIPVLNHRRFIDALFKHNMNQTKAYQEIYECTYETAMTNSSRLLRNAQIKAEVENRLEENTVSESEMLYHLSEIIRSDPDDLITTLPDGNWFVDYEKAKENGKSNLIERLKTRTEISEDGDIQSRVVDCKPYSRLQAIEALARIRARFQIDVNVNWQSYLPENITESQVIEFFKQKLKDAQSIEAQSELLDEKENNHEL